MPDLKIVITGDASGLEAAAKDGAAALGGLQQAAGGAAGAARQAAPPFAGMGAAVTKSAGQIKQGRRIVVQNLADMGQVAVATSGNFGSMASVLPDLLYGLREMGVAAGPVAVGLGAVAAVAAVAALAIRGAGEEERNAAKYAGRLATVNETLRTSFERARDAAIDYKVATGQMTEEEGKIARIRVEALDEVRKETAPLRKELGELNKAAEGLWPNLLDAMVVGMKGAGGATAALGTLLERNTDGAFALRTEAGKVATSLDIQTEAIVASYDELEESTKAQEAATREDKAAALALERLQRGYEDEAAELRTREDMIHRRRQLTEAEQAAELAGMRTSEDRIRAKVAGHEREAAAAKSAAGIVTEAASTMLTEEQRIYQARAETLAAYMEQAEAAGLRQQQIAADTATINQSFDWQVYESRAATLSEVVAMTSTTMDASSALVEAAARRKIAAHGRESKEARKAARDAFKAQKALALASAVVGTAVAVVNGLQTQPFVPVGIISAIAAGIAGGIQIAAIAAEPMPSFYAGTGQFRPSGMGAALRSASMVGNDVAARSAGHPAILHRDEAVVTPAGVDNLGGPEAIRRANSGRAPERGGDSYLFVDSRAFGKMTRDAMRSGVGPLADLARGSRTPLESYYPYPRSR